MAQIETVTITTAGSAGSATGSGVSSSLNGFLTAIVINYDAAIPATTDIAFVLTYNGVSKTFLTVTDSATDAWIHPTFGTVDSSNVANSDITPFIPGLPVTINVTGADAVTNGITVHFFVAQA